MNFKVDDFKNKKNFQNLEIIDSINGSYLDKLIIGQNVVWDIDEQIPEHIRPVKHCIPSDI